MWEIMENIEIISVFTMMYGLIYYGIFEILNDSYQLMVRPYFDIDFESNIITNL